MFNFIKKLLGAGARSDDETLNEQIQDILPAGLIQLAVAGENCDSIAGASGLFGLEHTNPVPVNGIKGEIKYINRLLCPCGKYLMAHRLGSIKAPGSEGAVDVYETVCSELAHWDIMYFHFYHPRRSLMVPKNYSRDAFHSQFSKTIIGMTTNTACRNFPAGMGQIVTEMLGPTFGASVMKKIGYKTSQPFKRPAAHIEKIMDVIQTGLFEGHVSGDVLNCEAEKLMAVRLRNEEEQK